MQWFLRGILRVKYQEVEFLQNESAILEGWLIGMNALKKMRKLLAIPFCNVSEIPH